MAACHVSIPTDTRNTSPFATAKSSRIRIVRSRRAAHTSRLPIVLLRANSKIKIGQDRRCSSLALVECLTCDTVMAAGLPPSRKLQQLRTSLVTIVLSASRAKIVEGINQLLLAISKLGASLVLRGKAEVAVLFKSTAPWIRQRMLMILTRRVWRTSLPPNMPPTIKHAAEVRSAAIRTGTTHSNRPPKQMHKTSTLILIKTGMQTAAMLTPRHTVNRHQILLQLAAKKCTVFQTNHWSK